MTNSIALMRQQRIIKKAPDGLYIPIEQLHLVDGWDGTYDKIELLDACHDLAKRLILDEATRTLRDFTAILEPIKVWPRDPSGVWVVKGHRTVRTYHLLQGLGFKLPAIRIIPFEGTAVQRNVNMNSDKEFDELDTLAQAVLVLDMVDRHGMTVAEISRDLDKKRQVIEQLLQLARAPEALHEEVRLGHIRAFTALHALKLFGNNAAQVVAKLFERNAGKRVMPKHLNEESGREAASSQPPCGIDALLERVPVSGGAPTAEAVDLLQRYREGEELLGDMPLSLSVRDLNALVTALASTATAPEPRKTRKPPKGEK